MKLNPVIIVTATVLLGLVSAVILKEASSQPSISLLFLSIIFMTVITINGARFFLWGQVHKYHPVSLSYPMSSVFFPLILLVEHYLYGEPVSTLKLISSLIIMLGVALLVTEESTNATSA